MNKPAPKEPSMDEILSSIRQIIADDDSARGPEPQSGQAGQPGQPGPLPSAQPTPPPAAAVAPLPLSAAQIVPEAVPAQASAAASAQERPLDGEDSAARAFERDLDEEAVPATPADEEEGPIGFEEAQLVEGDDVAFEADAEAISETPEPEPFPEPPPVRPAAPVGKAAPLPDPSLTADMAEQLLGPAAEAAVRHTFTRLGTIGIGTPGVTVESMMREMLRPMLKEWLDEHLPSVVERMVEREISRISRGGD